MSLASEAVAIQTKIRNAIAVGGNLLGADLKEVLDFVYAVDTANTAYATVVEAQFVILQAGGAGDISADVDAAETAITAAKPSVITASTSSILDGNAS